MATVVVVDAHQGSLSRWELGGEAVRLTHSCHAEGGGPITFTKDVVEGFRVNPPEEFRVEPPPEPTGPKTDAGSLPCDVERAA